MCLCCNDTSSHTWDHHAPWSVTIHDWKISFKLTVWIYFSCLRSAVMCTNQNVYRPSKSRTLNVCHLFVSSCFKLEKFDKPAKLKWVKASAFLHDSFVNRGFKTVYNVIMAIAEDLVCKRKQKGIKMLNTWAESKLPLRAK